MFCVACACERPADHDHETNDGLGWTVMTQRCWYCGTKQVSVHPSDAFVDQFECGVCHLMTAVESDEPDDIAAYQEVG
jgi:hypothetical protein